MSMTGLLYFKLNATIEKKKGTSMANVEPKGGVYRIPLYEGKTFNHVQRHAKTALCLAEKETKLELRMTV